MHLGVAVPGGDEERAAAVDGHGRVEALVRVRVRVRVRVSPKSGRASVPWQLPDNLGVFELRAYAVRLGLGLGLGFGSKP